MLVVGALRPGVIVGSDVINDGLPPVGINSGCGLDNRELLKPPT